MSDRERAEEAHAMEEFLEAPTGDLAAWQQVWEGDIPLPIQSHRGLLGRLVVFLKRILRPLVKVPQNDLWERQRAFNLALLDRLENSPELDRLRWNAQEYKDLSIFLTRFFRTGIDEIVGHNDALYSSVDQKLDRYRRESKRLWAELGGALALADASGSGDVPTAGTELRQATDEMVHLELEHSVQEPGQDGPDRLEGLLEFLPDTGKVLELGCGHGERLEFLIEHGYGACGIEPTAAAAQVCRSRGLDVAAGDLAAGLAAQAEGSLAAVVALSVVERLAPTEVAALVRLAWRALEPGGVLLLETPNPLSLMVAASSFWLDPDNLRPVHPEGLTALLRAAGFEPVRRLERHPFDPADGLPEIALEGLDDGARELADRVNRLRDRLDDLLFGHRDYAVVGVKPLP